MECEFTSHADEVLSEFLSKKTLALDLIGELAEGYAKENCPVRTARLKNSISHQTEGDTAYIGTDVEYALWVEVKDVRHENGQAHFLRDAATQHGDEYKSLAETVLRE